MAFVSYLDAARTDKASPLLTMAGYICAYVDWLPFEEQANAICAREGVTVIHGYDLHNGNNDFEGWTRDRKKAFVTALQAALKPTGAIGIAYSVQQHEFRAAKKLHKIMPNESPYGFAFRKIVDTICGDPVMRMNFETVKDADISFILESGDNNYADAERILAELQKNHPFRGRLKAITSAPKESTRSLQMADLLAFYSRRHINKYDPSNDRYPEVPEMLEILHTNVFIEPIVAHTFRPKR